MDKKWTKTIQNGERKLIVQIVRIPGSVLCPVTAYSKLVDLQRAKPQDPAFLFRSSPGHECVTQHTFAQVLRTAIDRVGLAGSLFSGHSFRRGGATTAFMANVPGELIKIQGDWASDAYLKYLEMDLNSKLTVGTLLREYIYKLEK